MRERAYRCVVSLLLCGALPSCNAGPSVSVDVRTDLVPALQFVRIETTIAASTDEDPSDAAVMAIRQTAHNVEAGEDYVRGVRVADLSGLAHGSYRLEIHVLDAHAGIIAARRVDVAVQHATSIVVVITRDCTDVDCPGDGDPSLTECVNGECVPPACSASATETCGMPECTADADCEVEGCARATCASGSCLLAPDDSLCASDQICWVDLACIPAPAGQDAGPLPGPDDDPSTVTGQDAYIIPELDASVCVPGASCAALGYECGNVVDACGASHACGTCPAGMACNIYHRCQSSCVPAALDMTGGGGTCADLEQAYTARGINVGYYPFHVRSDIAMYSGDFDGTPGTTFHRGATRSGVVLQTIHAGAYVGLASTGPFYGPPSGDCSPSGETCGDPSRAACSSALPPPMRAPRQGYVWGYAYSGGSHMQGWIPADWGRLVFAGFNHSHPCARGPAGVDFEVSSACGVRTACRGSQSSCPATNHCNEGGDDCARTECGAMSGGVLTPSAWQRVVTLPSARHACAMHVPDPSIRCLANGSDQDFFLVYPFGAYLYWAQNSTTKAWIHYGDHVQAYFHNRDAQGVLWDFVEVTQSGAPMLTPASDGSGASSMRPCLHGGTCGWVQDVFLQ